MGRWVPGSYTFLRTHDERSQAMDIATPPFTLGTAVIGELRHPLLVVDGGRAIHLRNRLALAMLARGDRLAEREGRLYGIDAEADAGIDAALRELALSRRDRWMLRLGGGEHAPVAGIVTRLTHPGTPDLAVIALLPPHAEARVMLASMFGLTPAEARVAGHIAEGWSPKRIAQEGGVSTSTVRSQVRNLFVKTGVNRQADLARVMLLASAL